MESEEAAQRQFSVEGVTCASCVNKIETTLNKLGGVSKAEMNFALRTLTVTGDVSTLTVIDALERIGYQAEIRRASDDALTLLEKEKSDQLRYAQLVKQTTVALLVGLPIMAYGIFFGDMRVDTPEQQSGWFVVGCLSLAVMLYSGRHFYLSAWRSIVNHAANMDTLIALGTCAAWGYSMVIVLVPDTIPDLARHVYFEAAVMVVGLVDLGLALDLKAQGKASDAIRKLIKLQPKTARVMRNDEFVDIDIAQVVLGDLIRVRPGEKVAVDGDVVSGSTFIDESMLTGEPMPIEKALGDRVIAGAINKSGSIDFKATGVGENTTLAHIVQMVKRAQSSKPPIGRIADVIAGYFVPSVMILSVLTALMWLNFGPDPAFAYALVCATTVLIIACPCALGLATPMSVMVGVAKAAELGVLIRNGEALQTASKLTVIVLDKTGTITEGAPQVTDVLCCSDYQENNVLQLAASLEAGSEHPLAAATLNCAKARKLALHEIDDFKAIAGQGVSATVQGQVVRLGNAGFMNDNDIDAQEMASDANVLSKEAKTPIYFAIDQRLVALIAVADPIKKDSIAAISRLQALGMRVLMVTGDNETTAKAVAKQVDIDEYLAEVMPDRKAAVITALKNKGEIVGMVGDGINDAPALAFANVGFAMGTGTDVAIESADVTLMRGSLHGLADAVAVSRATLLNIKQNLIGAFIYNVAGLPIAAGILFPIWGVLLNPVFAGAAMAMSSVTVVTNANRLRFFRPGGR